MKNLLTILLVLLVSGLFAQQQDVHLTGKVTEGPVGIPVVNQPVYIMIMMGNDSLITTVNLMTNDSGYYAHSFPMYAGVAGRVDVSTPDCNGDMLSETVFVIPGNSYIVDFNICSNSTGCLSQFTYYPDSVFYAIQFIDLSSGTINSWSWDFGDGTTSSLQNPLHIFPEEGEYEVCLTISGPECQSTWCQAVFVNGQGGCYNYFTYQSTGTMLSLAGFHSTNLPASYFWDFGDGTSGEGQSVTHQYAAGGVYYVTLNTLDSVNCAATSWQNVVVGDTILFNQVWGQVFAGNFPQNGGQVMIYSTLAGPGFMPYNSLTDIDPNGVFVFPYVPDGEFVLLAIPSEGNPYLPAYYGDVLHWDGAIRVVPGETLNPCNINLALSGSAPVFGTGSIAGEITQSFSGAVMTHLVNVLIYDQDYQVIGFDKVSANGSFGFENLAMGTYFLYPELAGTTSAFIRVDITDVIPQAIINLSFDGSSILGEAEVSLIPEFCMIYPNPVFARASVTISCANPSSISLMVTDLSGRPCSVGVYEATSGINTIELPVTVLSPGIYILNISDESGGTAVRKFVKH